MISIALTLSFQSSFNALALGLQLADLTSTGAPLRSETDVALAVANGDAVAGLGVAAVAQQLRLNFILLVKERYDLLIWRRHYFTSSLQKLLAFTKQTIFYERAENLGGYDISDLGKVRFNGLV